MSTRLDPADVPERLRPVEAFLESSGSRLYRTCVLMTSGVGDGADLYQEVVARLWQRYACGTDLEPLPQDDFYAYARRIAANLTTDDWRRRRRLGLAVNQIAARVRGITGDASESVAVRQLLLGALARLPKRQRLVVVLRYWEDMTEDQIAITLSCSVGTVKSQLSRATAKLRVLLKEEFK